MKRIDFVPIVVVVIVLVLGSGVFYYYSKNYISSAPTPPVLPEKSKDTQPSDLTSSTQKTASTANESGGIPNPKTYHNDEFGFTLTYSADQRQPNIVYIDSATSSVFYDPAAEFDFSIYLYRDPSKFYIINYNYIEGNFGEIKYSQDTKQFVVASNSKPFEKRTTNQNVPYYQITTGIHAGAYVNVFVINKGMIVLVGADYFSEVNDVFRQDIITFDNPQSVLKVTSLVVPLEKK